MGNSTSNPISINQIVDTNLDLKCITPPTCRTLPNDVQAIVDDYCKTKFDKSKIVNGCLTGFPADYDLHFLLNKIIAKECTTTTTPGGTTPVYITDLNYCDSDLWTYTSDNCLFIRDVCGNPVTNVTELDVLRALIKRIISLEILIKQLKQLNDSQQVTINTHTSQIADIIQNCCNITMLSQIQTLNNRLASAGIP